MSANLGPSMKRSFLRSVEQRSNPSNQAPRLVTAILRPKAQTAVPSRSLPDDKALITKPKPGTAPGSAATLFQQESSTALDFLNLSSAALLVVADARYDMQ